MLLLSVPVPTAGFQTLEEVARAPKRAKSKGRRTRHRSPRLANRKPNGC